MHVCLCRMCVYDACVSMVPAAFGLQCPSLRPLLARPVTVVETICAAVTGQEAAPWLVTDLPLGAHAVRPCMQGGGGGAGRVGVGAGDARAVNGRQWGGWGEAGASGHQGARAETADQTFAPVMQLLGKYLKVKKVEGLRPAASLCVRGLVFSNQVLPAAYSGMPARRLATARCSVA